MANKILLVDDERPILSTFQRSFRSSDFELFTTEDGQQALDILYSEKIDVIISDMRMPMMDGHQLLRKVRDMYPDTIRLILSGHAEEKEITNAILDGSCKMYLLKPWDNKELTETLRQLISVRERLRDGNLLALINKIGGMCSPPQIIQKLMRLINEEAEMHQIISVIEEDPVMAAKVLHLANSAFYGMKTGSISQATVFLGLNAVKNIALMASTCDLLSNNGLGLFKRDAMWNYASLTNRFVNILYKRIIGKNISHIASSAGLLFGIGLMALVHQMPDKYARMAITLAQGKEKSLEKLEGELLGVTHDEIGGYLLDWWGLPHSIIECAMFHHDPFHNSVINRDLVAIVHLANYFAARLQLGFAGQIDERVFEFFNITQAECECLLMKNLS